LESEIERGDYVSHEDFKRGLAERRKSLR